MINEAIRSSFDIRDYSIVAEKEFPETFECEGVPTVKNQGDHPTCVAHAVSSVLEYHYNKQHSKARKFSTQFIYGFRDFGYYVGDGMMTRDALKTVQKHGDPFYSDCPGNSDYADAEKALSENIEELLVKASNHTITTYFRCSSPEEIKTALMNYGPVVMAMNFAGNIVDDMYVPDDSKGGGHCMFIYGWIEKGWLIQNSWGNRYAGDGRFTLPYDVKFTEAWGVTDEVVEDESMIKKPTKVALILYKIYNKIANFILDIIHNDR